eukprot:scaffold129110_cov19-Tisochrysis_lutea.AAC.1
MQGPSVCQLGSSCYAGYLQAPAAVVGSVGGADWAAKGQPAGCGAVLALASEGCGAAWRAGGVGEAPVWCGVAALAMASEGCGAAWRAGGFGEAPEAELESRRHLRLRSEDIVVRVLGREHALERVLGRERKGNPCLVGLWEGLFVLWSEDGGAEALVAAAAAAAAAAVHTAVCTAAALAAVHAAGLVACPAGLRSSLVAAGQWSGAVPACTSQACEREHSGL